MRKAERPRRVSCESPARYAAVASRNHVAKLVKSIVASSPAIEAWPRANRRRRCSDRSLRAGRDLPNGGDAAIATVQLGELNGLQPLRGRGRLGLEPLTLNQRPPCPTASEKNCVNSLTRTAKASEIGRSCHSVVALSPETAPRPA